MWLLCQRTGFVSLMVLASTTTAIAGGIERMAPSSRILFEEGRYLEFAFSYVDPNLDGEGGGVEISPGVIVPIAGTTGDIFDSFTTVGAAYKADLNERISYALSVDQPYGVRTDYPEGFYEATSANIDTITATTMVAYDPVPNVKLYGGLRAQRMEASGAVPFIGSYSVETDVDVGFGYMVGAAYERPAMAQRVALTYFSPIEHEFETVEFDSMGSTLEVETPQQLTLELQSGVSPTMLLFGSVTWAEWTDFVIDPTFYPPDRPMAVYEDNSISYSIGLGKQITPAVAGAVQVIHEPSSGTVLTTLGPVDGSTLVSGALSYEQDSYKVTGSVTYGWLGGARNELGTRFDDGTVWALGLRFGYRF